MYRIYTGGVPICASMTAIYRWVTRAPNAQYSKLITLYKHMEYDYSVATVL